jgi:anti-sigma-K factor RskA
MRRENLGNNTQESVVEGLGKRAAIIQRQQRQDETGELLSRWQNALMTCRVRSTCEKNLLLISNETSIGPQRKEESWNSSRRAQIWREATAATAA